MFVTLTIGWYRCACSVQVYACPRNQRSQPNTSPGQTPGLSHVRSTKQKNGRELVHQPDVV
jgi:hypothetical protein